MHHIIINPAAGRGQSLKVLPELVSLFKANGMPHEVLRTGAPGDASAIAKGICEKGGDGVIAIGGDGTVQEIVAGMKAGRADEFAESAAGKAGRADEFAESAAGKAVPLGIIPCGSANDFTLTTHGKATPHVADIFDAVKNNRTRTVDLIADSMGGTFLNIANLGLDARIVQNAQSLKKTFGGGAYLAAAFKSIRLHENIRLSIIADGKEINGDFTLAAICNGQYYGGGMRIAPSAKLDDGEITVVLVEAMSRAKTMLIFPSVIFERHVKFKEVRTFNCKEISLRWKGTQTLCLDGNLFGCEESVAFKVMPGALRLFT